MRFVRYWIEQFMEDPAERERRTREHLIMVQEGSIKLRERWEQPLRPKGFWNSVTSTALTKQRLSEAEAYNLSPYSRALQKMDADEQQAKNNSSSPSS